MAIEPKVLFPILRDGRIVSQRKFVPISALILQRLQTANLIICLQVSQGFQAFAVHLKSMLIMHSVTLIPVQLPKVGALMRSQNSSKCSLGNLINFPFQPVNTPLDPKESNYRDLADIFRVRKEKPYHQQGHHQGTKESDRTRILHPSRKANKQKYQHGKSGNNNTQTDPSII